MTTEPITLLKDGMLRKPDKPACVRWGKRTRFKAIAQAYLQYARKNYDLSAVVVFDDYKDKRIKSHEHQQCNMIPQSCDVKVDPENQMPFRQERFWSNIFLDRESVWSTVAEMLQSYRQHLISQEILCSRC